MGTVTPITGGTKSPLLQQLVDYINQYGPTPISELASACSVSEAIIKRLANLDHIKKVVLWYVFNKDNSKDWILATSAPASDGRPTHRLGRLFEDVEFALSLLPLFPNLYQQNDELILLDIANDHYKYIPVTRALLREMLSRVCTVLVSDKRTRATDGWREATFPDNVLDAMLSRKVFANVRRLLGVINWPLVTWTSDDVTYHTERGFAEVEKGVGYYVNGSWNMPRIIGDEIEYGGGNELPSLGMNIEDAKKLAIERLREPFTAFHTVDEKVTESVAIAYWLTAILRPMIGSVPAFVVRAAKGGAGKTLYARILYSVLTGKQMPTPNIPTTKWAGATVVDMDEWRKIIQSLVLEHNLTPTFDNCDEEVGGSELEALITGGEGSTQIRAMRTHTITEASFRGIFLFNGINPDLTGAMPRRVLAVDILHPGVGRVAHSWGNDKRFIEAVFARRKELIEACLILIAAYLHKFGWDHIPPIYAGYWPTFSDWAELITAIIRYAGGADPLEARISQEEGMTEEASVARVVLDCIDSLTVSGRIKNLVKICGPGEFRGILLADLMNEISDSLGANHPEDREIYNIVRKVIPRADMAGSGALDRAYVRTVNNHYKRSLHNQTIDGRRLVIGIDRNGAPVWASVKE